LNADHVPASRQRITDGFFRGFSDSGEKVIHTFIGKLFYGCDLIQAESPGIFRGESKKNVT